jgi:uncharacterized membrane protein HdeD (DUF308 family)
VTLPHNISNTGRWVRGISGVVLLAIGVLLVFATWPKPLWLRWIIAILLALLGAFQIFEARKGWCVLRACRIKTPI